MIPERTIFVSRDITVQGLQATNYCGADFRLLLYDETAGQIVTNMSTKYIHSEHIISKRISPNTAVRW